MPRTGGGATDDDEGLLDAGELRVQRVDQRLRALTFFGALLEVVQGREHHGGVRRSGEGRAVETDDRHGMGDAGRRQNDLRHPARHLVGARERSAGRKLDDIDQIALVLLRDEAGRRPGELEHGEADQTDIDHHHEARDAHQTSRQSAVAR